MILVAVPIPNPHVVLTISDGVAMYRVEPRSGHSLSGLDVQCDTYLQIILRVTISTESHENVTQRIATR
jgi:hypothetical protein